MKAIIDYGMTADGAYITTDFTFNKEGDTTTFWSDMIKEQVTITAGKILEYPTHTQTGAAFFSVSLKHRQWSDIHVIAKIR